jgi:hypothetical protein
VAKTKPDLSGVRLKLDRAEVHIKAFRRKIETFSKGDPPPFGFRTDKTAGPDKSVEYVLYAIVREPPPRELALLVGDALHSLRSALDHLVYELVPPRNRKSLKLQFPIFVDECEFKVRSPPMIKGIKGDERTLIERLQPYAAADPPQNDPLAILRKLSNLDKHRLLVPMISGTSVKDTWIGSDNAKIRWTLLERGPVEHDAKIVAFTATPEDPAKNMNVQPQSGLQIQLRDTGVIRSMVDIDAADLLDMLHSHVRHAVIDRWFTYGYMPPPNKLQT